MCRNIITARKRVGEGKKKRGGLLTIKGGEDDGLIMVAEVFAEEAEAAAMLGIGFDFDFEFSIYPVG